jgi:hypothetical protein
VHVPVADAADLRHALVLGAVEHPTLLVHLLAGQQRPALDGRGRPRRRCRWVAGCELDLGLGVALHHDPNPVPVQRDGLEGDRHRRHDGQPAQEPDVPGGDRDRSGDGPFGGLHHLPEQLGGGDDREAVVVVRRTGGNLDESVVAQVGLGA